MTVEIELKFKDEILKYVSNDFNVKDNFLVLSTSDNEGIFFNVDKIDYFKVKLLK